MKQLLYATQQYRHLAINENSNDNSKTEILAINSDRDKYLTYYGNLLFTGIIIP